MKIPHGLSHPVYIGSGAYSSVYRVYQKSLERHVALKSISLKTKDRVAFIGQEAKTLAAVQLSCVPHIYEIKRSGLQIHIVMEWIYGIPLSTLLEHSITLEMKMSIAEDLVHAVAQLHSAGVAHRDIKPENIMITPDRGIVFVDFGFSYQLHNQTDVNSKPLQGTPAYMAPELWADSGKVDYQKADLYSMGIVLKKLLESAFPETAETLIHVNPLLRPQSSDEFEKNWIRNNKSYKSAAVSTELKGFIAAFVANLLFKAAEILHGKNRREEAYRILTESLEIWPDNPPALNFFQQRFSMPLPFVNTRKILLWVAGVIATASALVGAYISGRSASSGKSEFLQPIVKHESDDWQNSFISLSGSMQKKAYKQVMLRDSICVNDITGTCVVLLPARSGNLFVDGRIQSYKADSIKLSLLITAGVHRIEWYDSLQKRRYSETIDLLPFSTKAVSFQRFMHE